jgi:vitamin B12 transporter
LKATYGTGFKAPSLYYLFDPVYGNNSLNPEDSRGWDAGIEHYFTSLSAGVTFFKMDFRQMFGLIFDEQRGEFRTININRAASEGVEVYIKSEIFPGLSLKG